MTKLSAFDAAYSLRDDLLQHILIYVITVYLAVLIYSLNISRGLYIVKKEKKGSYFVLNRVFFFKVGA